MTTLADYAILRASVDRTLPTLDFENPDHRREGQELLARLNRLGAKLVYEATCAKELEVTKS